VINGVRNGLMNTLPQKVIDGITAKQTVALPISGSCSGGDVTQCVSTINSLSGNLTVQNAQNAGFGTIGFAEINHMKCAIGHSAGCQALGLPVNIGQARACTTGQCLLRVRPSRVNFLADAIEVVLYDGPEFDRPAVALRVAAEGLPNPQRQQAISALCGTPARGPPYNRTFASISRAGRHR